jgi:hypothetical protein
MIEKLLTCLVLVSQSLVVAIGGHYFFVRVIVREQQAECKGHYKTLSEGLNAAQIATPLFARIHWCSLLIAGFAVNVAVIG